MMKFGIIGSGSWGTALAKILTDNGQSINWWNRNEESIKQFKERGHNPHYLSSAKFDTSLLNLTTDINEVVGSSDAIIVAIPSSFVIDALKNLPSDSFENKIVISAVKGILPELNILLNDYLGENFNVQIENYVAVLGPCHAEEVAAEKLSYLTFSGIDPILTSTIAKYFETPYLNTVINKDIAGVQYASVLKNIYAVGAGMAHGLEYGDNFLSVFIANSADEMAGFLRKAGLMVNEKKDINIGHDSKNQRQNYAASVYLGDLLVTCYSLHSRNRAFGNMIGKGYTVQAAKLEMNMIAEGYFASRSMYKINETVGASMPIAATIYKVLWNGQSAKDGFKKLEKIFV